MIIRENMEAIMLCLEKVDLCISIEKDCGYSFVDHSNYSTRVF